MWRHVRFALLSWLALNAALAIGIHLQGRAGPLEPADVIIVLGSAVNRDGSAGPSLTRRAARAATLWKDGVAAAILCTGGLTEGRPRSEAAACRDVLVAQGVPAAAIHLEDRSRSTEENARFSRPILDAQGWHSAALVTDPYHMLRARWIFSTFGIAHQPAPVGRDGIALGWYLNRLGREVIALQWQALVQVRSRGTL